MKASLIFLSIVLPLATWAGTTDNIFHDGSYLSARKIAKEEGKIQLLEFVAEWCLPCKHMDQTTFSDANVRSYLKDNFVSVKVDIDQFDGFALKEKYGVRYLPTIIILNADGEVIGKMEEALAPAPFLEKLKGITQVPEASSSAVEDDHTAKTSEQPKSPVKPIIPNTSDSVEKERHHVMLQFGVFKDEENARLLAEKITTFLPSSPEISKVSRADGKTLYKVIYGPFETDSEANDLKSDLESSGIESIIKPLE